MRKSSQTQNSTDALDLEEIRQSTVASSHPYSMVRLPTPGGGRSTTARGRTKKGLEVEPAKSKILQTDLETVLELPCQANRSPQEVGADTDAVVVTSQQNQEHQKPDVPLLLMGQSSGHG